MVRNISLVSLECCVFQDPSSVLTNRQHCDAADGTEEWLPERQSRISIHLGISQSDDTRNRTMRQHAVHCMQKMIPNNLNALTKWSGI